MDFITLLALSFALGADSFTVSVSNGIFYGKKYMGKLLFGIVIFAVAQGAMPLMGYAVGEIVSDYMQSFSKWTALILLGLVGGKMVYEALHDSDTEQHISEPSFRLLAVQAIATSIDAFTIGMSFAVLGVNLIVAIPTIAAVTALCCAVGIVVGVKFGQIMGNKATLAGGFLLILIGIKIFME